MNTMMDGDNRSYNITNPPDNHFPIFPVFDRQLTVNLQEDSLMEPRHQNWRIRDFFVHSQLPLLCIDLYQMNRLFSITHNHNE